MARIGVLGSGIVGSAAAWDLTRRGHEVVVGDADGTAVSAAAETAGAAAAIVHAEDEAELADYLDGLDLVVSGLPYRFGTAVAAASIATGTHYLDFGGNPTIVQDQLRLDREAIAAGLSVVPDCGLAPGMANVLAEGAINRLAAPIDEVRIRVGALPADPTGTLGYQLAFNPAGLVNEYAEPCEVLTDGELDTVEPLTGIEQTIWHPFGRLEAFHTAGGSSTLPRRHQGRVTSLDYKTLRFPGHAGPFRAMLEVGLFDESPQPGTGVAPRAVLLEALSTHLPTGAPDIVLVRVWGRSGQEVVGHEIVDRHDGRFSALARTTAFPATALADLIVMGAIEPGARAMDAAMTADQLIEGVAEVGISIDAYVPLGSDE